MKITFLSTFLKYHNFGFFLLILNNHVLQKDDGVLRQFCSSVFDNMKKSSAYKSEIDFALFGRTKGSDRIFSKENGMLLIKRLKIQPRRTPLAYGKGPVWFWPIFMEHACRILTQANSLLN